MLRGVKSISALALAVLVSACAPFGYGIDAATARLERNALQTTQSLDQLMATTNSIEERLVARAERLICQEIDVATASRLYRASITEWSSFCAAIAVRTLTELPQ